jgi:hypothetical protein
MKTNTKFLELVDIFCNDNIKCCRFNNYFLENNINTKQNLVTVLKHISKQVIYEIIFGVVYGEVSLR